MDKLLRKPNWLFFLFGFLMYANTIPFDYALDDKIVIINNEFTKNGISGISDLVTNDSMVGFFGRKKNLVSGGRYRPLALVTHAIEWEFFGRNPHISHFFNALLYGLTLLVLFNLLRLLFNEQKIELFSISVVATLIYGAHPLHTEVVANIKSRDELLSILFAFSAFWSFLEYYKLNDFKWLGAAIIAMGLSLFSKESSISFLAIIPLSVFFFLELNWKKLIIGIAPLFVISLLYLWVRQQVVGGFSAPIANELMNNPFLNATASQKFGSIFLTFLIYFKLLLFPHPLTHDYYPKQIPLVELTSALPLISLLINIALIGFAIYGLFKKNKWAYLMILYFASFILYANILFPIGTFMNERFAYVSSLSIALAIAFALKYFKQKEKVTLATAILGFVLVGFSAKTIHRNYAWQNDESLALTDVKVSTQSAKVNMSAGLACLEKAKAENNSSKKKQYILEAYNYLKASLEIYPGYIQPMLLMGNTYSEAEDYKNAVLMYRNVLTINPEYNHAILNLEYVGDKATEKGEFENAANAYETLIEFKPTLIRAYGKLGEVYGKNLGNLQKAEAILVQAYQMVPENTDIIQKLGVVYAIQRKLSEALEVFKQGEKVDPENARILMNIGLTYNNLGQAELGNQYLEKAFQIEPELRNGK